MSTLSLSNPQTSPGWQLLGRIGPSSGVMWSVYATVKEEARGPWEQVKLVADEAVQYKAGYWLKWNGERLALGREAQLLEQHRPFLRDELLELLQKVRGVRT